MGRLKLFIPLIICIAIGLFFYQTMVRIDKGEFDPQALPSALLNKPFPRFELVTVENPTQAVSEKALLGEIALVNVWGTWCPSCHIEHPFLNLLAARGVVIFGVNYKDEMLAAQRWLDEKGNPYKFNLFDINGKLGLDLGVTGAPETYVIDHRGFVRLRYQGPMNQRIWDEKFAPLFETLKQERLKFSKAA